MRSMSKSKKVKRGRATRPRPPPKAATPTTNSFPQEQKRGGLLVTAEFQKALEECKSRVEEIAADCRKKNRKFRDVEFDLELDKQRCLHGIDKKIFSPSDVQRVTQIFDTPSFFIDGADSNDIVQGAIGNCWFVSALATMSTCAGLIEKFCVARDEAVGVYGFIFFRDSAWVTVIIDDLLYTSIPKFEELSYPERQLYHDNKDVYNQSARKTGKSLYFAKSGTHGETWVPLVEKAYAKLHGNYASLTGGEAGEAIEDLTGGVTTFIYTKLIVKKDILDPDLFWTDELIHANTNRLFGCSYDALNTTRSQNQSATVNGLISAHAYSVLRAVEYNGKRFLKSGNLAVTISITAATSAVIVLSQLDERYWGPISGRAQWTFDFLVYKKGETKPVTFASPTLSQSRSVNTELLLEAGEYVVHDYLEAVIMTSEERAFARVLTEKAKSQTIASNFDSEYKQDFLPVPLDVIAGKDLSELEAKILALAKQDPQPSQEETTEKSASIDFGELSNAVKEVTLGEKGAQPNEHSDKEEDEADGEKSKDDDDDDDPKPQVESKEKGETEDDQNEGSVKDWEDDDGIMSLLDDDVIYLGLRVYTNKEAPAKINGQLRHLPLSALASLSGKTGEGLS
ncbi:hypothetical protein H0H93_010031 [Arthromyces matolae]|nr:hypothetical protein H0H93_010031 [Arthromyces matolae]